MSEISKDDRLVELMTEFLETASPKEKKKEDGFGQPGLDNKKMLEAIQEHRQEIDTLQKKLKELSEQLQKKQEQAPNQVKPITAPEITALQSSITNHATQIGDLMYKQKMLKTDIERKKQPKERRGFGWIGWLLVLSNLLLWSVVAYFLWPQFGSSSKQNDLVENSKTEFKSDVRKLKSTSPLVAADTLNQQSDQPKSEDSLNGLSAQTENQSDMKQNEGLALNQQVSKEEPTQQSSSTQLEAAPAPASGRASTKKVTPQPKKKAIPVKKVIAVKKQAPKKVKRPTAPSVQPGPKQAAPAQNPSTDQPDVTFGD